MREQFTFYRSFWEATKGLKAADRIKLIDAICSYALDEQEIDLTGVAASMFLLIRPTLDASKRKAENGRRRSKPEAKQKQDGSKPEANEKQNRNKNKNKKENKNEKEYEIESEDKKENECSLSCQGSVGGNPPPAPTKKKQSKRKALHVPGTPGPGEKAYGEYGWVILTDEQYAKLQRLMTPTELERCIRVVDERAQQSANRNDWVDWNLVIQRCAREGWGREQPQYNRGKGAQPAPGNLKQPVAMELGEAEMKAIQRMKEAAG